MDMELSIVIPAKNEEAALITLLPKLRAAVPDAEIIVVDDGSTDGTAQICEASGVKRVAHPYSKGNGAAIKSGVRKASRPWVLCMDADGQHDPEHIAALVKTAHQGYDMVVGARSHQSQATQARGLANAIYNRLASYMVGRPVADLTSGFRIFKRKKFLRFINLLPNGFSYPTTITMAFFRAGYSVHYIPIEAKQRVGTSHIHLLKDGIRFFMIIFKVGTLYSPLKVFLPLALLSFLLGMSNYLYTFMMDHRFTNMSAMLLMNSVLIFLLGLVSEQITALLYQQDRDESSS